MIPVVCLEPVGGGKAVACTEMGTTWGGGSGCVVLDLLSPRSLQHVYGNLGLGVEWGRGKESGIICAQMTGWAGRSIGDRGNGWGVGERGGLLRPHRRVGRQVPHHLMAPS